MDETGRHAALISRRGEQQASDGTAEMQSFLADFKLNDPRLLEFVKEFPGEATVVMQTIWPNLIVQQQSNTLATRQLVIAFAGSASIEATSALRSSTLIPLTTVGSVVFVIASMVFLRLPEISCREAP